MAEQKKSKKQYQPHSSLLYGITIDRKVLLSKLKQYYENENQWEEIFNMDQLEKKLNEIFGIVKKNKGTTLHFNWCLCDVPISRKTLGRSDVVFITTQYYATSGVGYSYANIGNSLEIEESDTKALEYFCKILKIEKEQTIIGFSLLSGILLANK